MTHLNRRASGVDVSLYRMEQQPRQAQAPHRSPLEAESESSALQKLLKYVCDSNCSSRAASIHHNIDLSNSIALLEVMRRVGRYCLPSGLGKSRQASLRHGSAPACYLSVQEQYFPNLLPTATCDRPCTLKIEATDALIKTCPYLTQEQVEANICLNLYVMESEFCAVGGKSPR